jgi:hypothetical protein
MALSGIGGMVLKSAGMSRKEDRRPLRFKTEDRRSEEDVPDLAATNQAPADPAGFLCLLSSSLLSHRLERAAEFAAGPE